MLSGFVSCEEELNDEWWTRTEFRVALLWTKRGREEKKKLRETILQYIQYITSRRPVVTCHFTGINVPFYTTISTAISLVWLENLNPDDNRIDMSITIDKIKLWKTGASFVWHLVHTITSHHQVSVITLSYLIFMIALTLQAETGGHECLN